MSVSSVMKSASHPRARLALVRAASLVALATLSTLAAAGCGGNASGGARSLSSAGGASGAASSAASSAGTPGSGSPPSTAQLYRDELAFAKCMRSNGVPQFPDPASSGGGFRVGAGVDLASPVARMAEEKCHKLLPRGGPPTHTHPSAGTLARFRGIARCMRARGVPQFPDPRTSIPSNLAGPIPSSRGAIGEISDIEGVIFLFPTTIDQQSPAFAHAAATCGFPLHNH